jgi:hypothetical protein
LNLMCKSVQAALALVKNHVVSTAVWASSAPDGQITFARRILSSPLAKNIPLCFLRKSPAYFLPSRPSEGRFAIVTNVGWDAVDAAVSGARQVIAGRVSRERQPARRRMTQVADGEVVWS